MPSNLSKLVPEIRHAFYERPSIGALSEHDNTERVVFSSPSESAKASKTSSQLML